jgi:AraC-like DNA-binding protein
MRPLYEKVRSSGRSTCHISTRADPDFAFNWHYHPEYELTLIVDSYGQRLVGDGIADYGPGDIVLVGPNLPHSWRSTPGPTKVHRAVVVQFLRDFPGERFFDLEQFRPVAQLLDRSVSGLAFGGTRTGDEVAAVLAQLPAMSESDQFIHTLWALNRLAAEADAQVLSKSQQRPTYRIEYQNRVDTLCAYLERHFDEEIDHAKLADLAHMDQASLCRFFKRATGRTMTAYVNELRVASATNLLLETDLSVLEIGYRVGFGNHSNFNRQFRRLKKMSPGQIRNRFRHDEPARDPSLDTDDTVGST